MASIKFQSIKGLAHFIFKFNITIYYEAKTHLSFFQDIYAVEMDVNISAMQKRYPAKFQETIPVGL